MSGTSGLDKLDQPEGLDQLDQPEGLDKLDQPEGLHQPSVLDADAVGELARSAAADPAREFGSFFLSRFLRLGIDYDDAEQTCTVVLPYAEHLCNPQGSVHGGVITTALDISMGHLCKRYLSTAVTIEMQMRFFRPLTSDATCTGRVVRAGRRIVHLESRMTDADGKLTALGTGSWHRLDAG